MLPKNSLEQGKLLVIIKEGLLSILLFLASKNIFKYLIIKKEEGVGERNAEISFKVALDL